MIYRSIKSGFFLGKIDWKIISDPDSLISKFFFLNKYYSNQSFLLVKPSSSASWGWRSILWGRDILIHGLKWRMGNRDNIHIGEDWLLGMMNPIRFNSATTSYLSLKVKELYDANCQWRRPLLPILFPSQEVDAITALHIPINSQDDNRIWSFETNKMYSVKSAYNLAMKLQSLQRPINSSHIFLEKAIYLYTRLWLLKMTSKLQSFFWRLLLNICPTMLSLPKRWIVQLPNYLYVFDVISRMRQLNIYSLNARHLRSPGDYLN